MGFKKVRRRVGSRCFKKLQQGMKGARRFLRFYKFLEGSGRFKEVQRGSMRFKHV